MSRRLAPIALVISVGFTSFVATPAQSGTLTPTSISAYVGPFQGQTSHNLTRPDSTTVSATFSSTAGNNGVPLELWAKPYGSTWRKVTTLATDGVGKASRSVSPLYNTTFMWKFLADSTRASSSSNYVTVRVHPKVTLSLADASIRAGQAVVARGYVRPAKPGATATLWRVTPTGWVKLGSNTIRSDGTYAIRKVLWTRTAYSLVVTVPAASGNLKGTSPARSLSVS